ncbi:MAG: PaaI family thioesterase [Alphaproteobacteria bacterium]|nr:PaaI family thioesterase [Alphaproteobacteria bacterium]
MPDTQKMIAPNSDFEKRVKESFRRQSFMDTLGVRLGKVEAGYVELELPFNEGLCQQHGFFHGGVISTLVDNSCGFASFTMMPAHATVLTVEFKVNILSPGIGDKLVAKAQVKKAGRKLVISQSDIFAVKDGEEKLCATGIGTMMVMENLEDSAPLKG